MKQSETDGKLRLTILGGYLGSGKTTWLRHNLYEGAFGTAHVLVNEAAETPVDDALLKAQVSGLTMLAGGCACCTGRSELIAALRSICNQRAAHSIDRIILETSGLADPAAILDAIRSDPVLVHHINIDEIIVLLDALHAKDQLSTEYLSRAQIEAADRIVLTKPDAVDPSMLASIALTAQQLNPIAAISAANKGVPAEIDNLPKAAPLHLPTLTETLEPITPCQISIPLSTDWASFSVWLSALLFARGSDLVRVKGVMNTPAGPLLLQAVRRSVQPPEVLPKGTSEHENQIVFIGRGYDPDALRRSLNYFTG